MLNRRQFLLHGLQGLGGWMIAAQIARRIEFLAEQENRAYLVEIAKPTRVLYATSDSFGYTFGLDQPYDQVDYPSFNWRQWFEMKGVDFYKPAEVEAYFVDQGDYDPDGGIPFVMPDLEADVPSGLIENYIEWEFARRDSPMAQAFNYLDGLPLANLHRPGDDPLGGLEFYDGTMPGVNTCLVAADNLATIAGLQQRLLQLGESVEIRID